MKKIIRAITSFLFIWLAVSTGLYLLSGTIIYKTGLSRNESFSVPHERIFIRNSAGEKIDTLWAPKSGGAARKTYLYLHGNAGRLPFIVEGLASHGNLLAPAYPGFSGSEGSPDTDNINEILDLSIEFLRAKGIGDKDIVVFGHSLGGSPAVHAAGRYPDLGRVILVNTFYSIKSMCEGKYYIFCVFAGGIHDSAAMAPLAKAPVRQFHDRDDLVVPFEEGERLFDLIGSPDKKFTVIHGSHSDFDVGGIISTD